VHAITADRIFSANLLDRPQKKYDNPRMSSSFPLPRPLVYYDLAEVATALRDGASQ
jgi:hypothetical protein